MGAYYITTIVLCTCITIWKMY